MIRSVVISGCLIAFFLSGCGTSRPWQVRVSEPPRSGEEDVTVTLASGKTATYRVSWGRMRQVEPGIYAVVERNRTEFRMSELPVFGMQVSPLSGRHRLRCEYDHPEVVDAAGKKRTHMDLPGIADVGPGTGNVTHYNALDFATVEERWRVPGTWTFSVFDGATRIKSVTFADPARPASRRSPPCSPAGRRWRCRRRRCRRPHRRHGGCCRP